MLRPPDFSAKNLCQLYAYYVSCEYCGNRIFEKPLLVMK